jgi:predicted phage baseplate assembly protein
VPSCAVVLRLDCRVSGVGVDPTNPPLQWEAWTGGQWTSCDVEKDETGGLNRPGDIIVHVPEDHRDSIIAGERAGWLRCRLLAPQPEQRTYSESPQVKSLSAFTMGGTTRTMHAEVVREEELGVSDGTPAQRFRLGRSPVVPWEEPSMLAVLDGDGVTQWHPVEHFAESGPDDHVFRLDPFVGEVQFGPAVRQADGSLRCYGSIPPKGSLLRLAGYRTGGGAAGNLSANMIHVLKTSNPDISRVENRRPAVGGADAESLEDAKIRGPLLLRSRSRAVTAEDYVQLTMQVAPEIGRVHCVATESGPDVGGVRVLLVPRVTRDGSGRIRREDLQPLEQSLQRITAHLTERKLIGTRLVVEPPDYVWLTAVVSVTARPRFRSDDVRSEVLQALYRLFDPLIGGADQRGWPFGRAVQASEVNAALSQVRGVDLAEDMSIRLFPADPVTGHRGTEVPRLRLGPTSLVHSFEHQVRVRS